MRALLLLLAGVATASVGAAPAWAATFLPDDFDLSRFLAPPPPAEVTAREVAALHALEAARTPDQVARARADVDESVAAFATLFGPAVTPLAAPRTADLFARVTEDAAAAFNRAKAVWRRPRPAAVDPSLHPCVPTPATSAYPSGHAVLGMLYALLLSDMLPEWRERLHARAREYAGGREVCGIHYPSDTQAGEMAAAALAARLATSPAFGAGLAGARAELRVLLGLPARAGFTAAAPLESPAPGEDFRVR